MYENATMIDSDFLRDELGYTLDGVPPIGQRALYKEYYRNICNAIHKLHYLRPTPTDIEELLLTGEHSYADGLGNVAHILCPISNEQERKYLFRLAQAKQLIYDATSGRGSMLRGEDARFNLCPDAVDYIKQLGLFQRTFCCQ